MSLNRSVGRNVLFYDASSPTIALGGLFQNGSVSEANFLQMLEIVLLIKGPIRVQHRISGEIVSDRDVELVPGDYDIYSNNKPVQVNDEPFIQRLISHSLSGRENRFRDTIRYRDRRCVISGLRHSDLALSRGQWAPFEATHIFPVEKESIWRESRNSRWITDPEMPPDSTKIHSPQNGILLASSIHMLFDQYLVSINPKDGYKIIAFDDDPYGVGGRILDSCCRNPEDPHHVPDPLLLWHFRQSVFANMRGNGEPIFEHDFEGLDMVRAINEGPYGKERFEMELEYRLLDSE